MKKITCHLYKIFYRIWRLFHFDKRFKTNYENTNFANIFHLQEYNLPEVKDRQFLIAVHKRAKKKGFDINRYNQLREEAHAIENDLKRLRDPLYIRHSPIAPSKLGTTQQIINDQLFQQAMTMNNPNADSSKRPLTERLASILESTAKKLKK